MTMGATTGFYGTMDFSEIVTALGSRIACHTHSHTRVIVFFFLSYK